MKKVGSTIGMKPTQLITNQIAELGDWREGAFPIGKVILESDAGITEDWKRNTAVDAELI